MAVLAYLVLNVKTAAIETPVLGNTDKLDNITHFTIKT